MTAKVAPTPDLPRYHFSAPEAEKLHAMGMAEEAASFTLDDVFRMMRAGALDPDAKVELIDGELVEMASQNSPHMYAKPALLRRLLRDLGDDVMVHVEGTLRLAPRTAPSPDVFVHRSSVRVEDVRGPDVLLLIEVADSSLLRDLQAKAALYARFGIADYWVVDALGRRIFIHRNPRSEGYAEVDEFDLGGRVSPLAFPEFTFEVSEIPPVG